jgi:hypothetical protein
MEARFPPDYPTSPFMLRVVWPPCVPYTGHVTIGGTVCTEALTPAGWKASYTFEGVVRSTLYEMANSTSGKGGLRVDSDRARQFPADDYYSVNEAREALDRLINVHGWNLNNNEATAAHPEEFESTENKMEEEEAQGYKFSTKDVSNALYGSNGSVNVNEQEWWGCDLWSLVTDVNEILTDDDTAMCYSVIDVGSGVFRVVLDVEETSNFRGNVWNCRDGKRFRFHLSWDCVRSAPAVKVEVGNVGWVVSQTDISIQRAAKKHENLDTVCPSKNETTMFSLRRVRFAVRSYGRVC